MKERIKRFLLNIHEGIKAISEIEAAGGAHMYLARKEYEMMREYRERRINERRANV